MVSLHNLQASATLWPTCLNALTGLAITAAVRRPSSQVPTGVLVLASRCRSGLTHWSVIEHQKRFPQRARSARSFVAPLPFFSGTLGFCSRRCHLRLSLAWFKNNTTYVSTLRSRCGHSLFATIVLSLQFLCTSFRKAQIDALAISYW